MIFFKLPKDEGHLLMERRGEALDALTALLAKTMRAREAREAAFKIHKAICKYQNSLSGSVVKPDRTIEVTRAPDQKATDALRRLAETKGALTWRKAWICLPERARYAVSLAVTETGMSESVIYGRSTGEPWTISTADPAVIAPLIPRAIEIASTFKNTKPERDHAVIAIMICCNGMAAKETDRIIEAVEKIYSRIVPGFGGWRSKATRARLARAAKEVGASPP